MKHFLLTCLLLITASSAMASGTVRCTGADRTGKSVTLTMYENVPTVNINGDMLNVVGPTRDGQGVVTQNFVTTTGAVVYDSIWPTSNTSVLLTQFNAVSQLLLAQANLSCVYSGFSGASPNLIDHPIFKSIRR